MNKKIAFLIVLVMVLTSFSTITAIAQTVSASGQEYDTSNGIHQLTSTLTITLSSTTNPTEYPDEMTFTDTVSGGTSPYLVNYTVNGTQKQSAYYSTTDGKEYVFTPPNAGYFNVYASVKDDTGTTVDSSTIVAYFDSAGTPSISASQTTVDASQGFSFTSSISSGYTSSPYTYQWFEEAPGDSSYSAISGATSSTYSTSETTTGSYGFYLNISDSAGVRKKSNVETITVNPALSVSISSSKNPADSGQQITFSSSVSGGTPPYTYQWLLNGTAISGATNSTWTTSFTVNTGAVEFTIQLEVKDSAGDPQRAVPSPKVPNIIINPNPDPATTRPGDSFGFSISQIGDLNLFMNPQDYSNFSYQWFYPNGTAIPGARNHNYGTYENHPGIYVFTIVITSKGSSYPGKWIGKATENVTNITQNDSVIFTESGLPIGSVWSAAIVVLNKTSPYPYGTTFLDPKTGFFSTVRENGLPEVVISPPPNETWTWYIDLFSPGPSGYIKGIYQPSISMGNITLPSDAINGSIVIHISFTLIENSSSLGGNTTSSNSPHKIEFLERGLPIGSSWSVSLANSTMYANGSGPYSKVLGQQTNGYGSPGITIETSPGIWNFYVDLFTTGPVGYVRGIYASNITSGTITISKANGNSTIIILLSFTLIANSNNTTSSTSQTNTSTANESQNTDPTSTGNVAIISPNHSTTNSSLVISEPKKTVGLPIIVEPLVIFLSILLVVSLYNFAEKRRRNKS